MAMKVGGEHWELRLEDEGLGPVWGKLAMSLGLELGDSVGLAVREIERCTAWAPFHDFVPTGDVLSDILAAFRLSQGDGHFTIVKMNAPRPQDWAVWKLRVLSEEAKFSVKNPYLRCADLIIFPDNLSWIIQVSHEGAVGIVLGLTTATGGLGPCSGVGVEGRFLSGLGPSDISSAPTRAEVPLRPGGGPQTSPRPS